MIQIYSLVRVWYSVRLSYAAGIVRVIFSTTIAHYLSGFQLPTTLRTALAIPEKTAITIATLNQNVALSLDIMQHMVNKYKKSGIIL